MIHDCFFLVQYIENSAMSLRCLGALYIVVVVLHIMFVFGQTFFIFKHHKVSVNHNTNSDWVCAQTTLYKLGKRTGPCYIIIIRIFFYSGKMARCGKCAYIYFQVTLKSLSQDGIHRKAFYDLLHEKRLELIVCRFLSRDTKRLCGSVSCTWLPQTSASGSLRPSKKLNKNLSCLGRSILPPQHTACLLLPLAIIATKTMAAVMGSRRQNY